MATGKLNNFYHKEIIDILSDGMTVNGTSFPPFKDAAGIKNGFCFSLVMDWLNDPVQACKKYWKAKNDAPKDVPKYVSKNTSVEQYVYFQKLADYFVDYCNAYGPVFKVKENQLNFSITLVNGKEKSETIVADPVLFSVNNSFTMQHYGWAFQYYGNRFYEKNNKSIFLTSEFDMRYKTGYKILVNLFSHSYTQDAKLDRHSIGMIKLPVSFREKKRYLFFDPRYGVFCTDDHRTIFNTLLGWYAEKGLYPVCIQYNAVQWE